MSAPDEVPAKKEVPPGRLPREEVMAEFHGIKLTNRRILVELPDYVHTVQLDQLNEMAFTMLPMWQRIESVWPMVVRGGMASSVTGAAIGGFVGLNASDPVAGFSLGIGIFAVGMVSAGGAALWRAARGPTCVVNLATLQGVAGYPLRIPSSQLAAARTRFLEIATQAAILKDDPSFRRTLGFGTKPTLG